MAVAFGPTFCSSGLVLKSELLHSPEAQYGFCSKNTAIMVAKTPLRCAPLKNNPL